MELPPGRLTILRLHGPADKRDPAPGTQYLLERSPFTVGNVCTQSQDIMFAIQGISRFHCKLDVQHGAWWIHELGSTYGAWINGERVTSRKLVDGDQIVLGPIGDPAMRDFPNGVVLEFQAR